MRIVQVLITILSVGFLAGCSARTASLTVHSQPEGAFITENHTGLQYGTTPRTMHYELGDVDDEDGCYWVRGFDAKWVSGATASIESIRLCGERNGDYWITFQRDANHPGLGRDLDFAVKLATLREQRRATNMAVAFSLFNSWQNTEPAKFQPVQCRSRQVGSTVYTDCE